jgi:hypothetical protein
VNRTSASRLVALYVISLVGGAAVVEGWTSMNALADQARSERSGDTSHRLVGGAWLLDIDRDFMTAAKAFVRADGGTYALELGPGAEASALTVRFLPTYLRGELLPATHARTDGADWLLCYGCPYDDRPRYEALWTRAGYAILRRRA